MTKNPANVEKHELAASKTAVVHTGRLCIIYWTAQCVLGIGALALGAYDTLVFLTASFLGAFPVMAYAHFLFWGQGRHARHLKPWALRCAILMAIQLAASVYMWYAPQKETAILWVAATLLLTFVLAANQRFLKKA